MERGERIPALNFLNKDLEISTKINNPICIAESKNNLGLLFSSMGEFERSNEYYQSSLNFFEKFGDTESIAIILNNLGDLQIREGKWEESKINLEKALNLSSKPIAKISALLTLGELFKVKKEYERSKLFFEDAFRIIEKCDFKQKKIEYFNKLGELYLSWYNYEKEEQYLKLARVQIEEALKLSREYNMPENEAISYRNIGLVQYREIEIDNAIKSLNNSIEIFNQLDSNYESVCSAIELAKIFYEIGNNQESEKIAKSVLFDSIHKDFKILQIKGHILLGDITQKTNYYFDAILISKFNSEIYKRTCYLILERIRKTDPELKIKLLEKIKDINQDKIFDQFLNILISKLNGKKSEITNELPDSLNEQLHVFTVPS